ncbi:DUF2892 domain-containing protein [Bacillaceae bacterium S4-13-58]
MSRQNIGIINALVRITFGLTTLSYCTAKMVRRPWRASYLVYSFLGAMKVAEGITRFCPITALYQARDEWWFEEDEDEEEVFNPS